MIDEQLSANSFSDVSYLSLGSPISGLLVSLFIRSIRVLRTTSSVTTCSAPAALWVLVVFSGSASRLTSFEAPVEQNNISLTEN